MKKAYPARELRICCLCFLALTLAAQDRGHEGPSPFSSKPKPLVDLVGKDLAGRWKVEVKARMAIQQAAYSVTWKRIGKHGNWDFLMDKAIEIFERTGAGLSKKGDFTLLNIYTSEAQKLGCDDPFLKYLLLRSQDLMGKAGELDLIYIGKIRKQLGVSSAMTYLLRRSKEVNNNPKADDFISVMKAMELQGYGPNVLASCCRRAINAAIVEGGSEDVRLPSLWQQWSAYAIPELKVGTDSAHVANMMDGIQLIWDLPKKDMQLLERQLGAIMSACDKAKAADWWRNYLEGDWQISAAWAMRGGGWANTVTPEGWAGFRSHLILARKCLVKAWELDPRNGWAAASMITVCKGDGSGEERMWFERAVADNPFIAAPYAALANALMPRWGGSMDGLFAAATECRDTDAWTTPIPGYGWIFIESALDDAEQNPDLVWHDPRTWRYLDAFFGAGRPPLLEPGIDPASWDCKRLIYAWRCGQRKEAAQLWKDFGASLGNLIYHDATVFDAMNVVGGDAAALEKDCQAWLNQPDIASSIKPKKVEPFDPDTICINGVIFKGVKTREIKFTPPYSGTCDMNGMQIETQTHGQVVVPLKSGEILLVNPDGSFEKQP